MYVQTVLDVHKKYNALVMSAFNNDAGFVAALDKVSICSGIQRTLFFFLFSVLSPKISLSFVIYRLVVDL